MVLKSELALAAIALLASLVNAQSPYKACHCVSDWDYNEDRRAWDATLNVCQQAYGRVEFNHLPPQCILLDIGDEDPPFKQIFKDLCRDYYGLGLECQEYDEPEYYWKQRNQLKKQNDCNRMNKQ